MSFYNTIKKGLRISRELLLIRKLHSNSAITNIPTHISLREMECLYNITASLLPGAVVLEIGSYLGASANILAAALRHSGGKLYCIDTWKNETMPEGLRDTYSIFTQNICQFNDIIVTVRKSSFELKETDVPSDLQMVFLDGDHSYEGVKNDFEFTNKFLTSGGMMVFHDAIHFPGVTRVIGEALSTGEWIIAGIVDNLMWLEKRS